VFGLLCLLLFFLPRDAVAWSCGPLSDEVSNADAAGIVRIVDVTARVRDRGDSARQGFRIVFEQVIKGRYAVGDVLDIAVDRARWDRARPRPVLGDLALFLVAENSDETLRPSSGCSFFRISRDLPGWVHLERVVPDPTRIPGTRRETSSATKAGSSLRADTDLFSRGFCVTLHEGRFPGIQGIWISPANGRGWGETARPSITYSNDYWYACVSDECSGDEVVVHAVWDGGEAALAVVSRCPVDWSNAKDISPEHR